MWLLGCRTFGERPQAETYKIPKRPGLTGVLHQVGGFRARSADHYTMEPPRKTRTACRQNVKKASTGLVQNIGQLK